MVYNRNINSARIEKEVNNKMNNTKCSVCGGDLIRDYAAGICRCAHCGNSRPIGDIEAGYKDFAHITEKLAKAETLIGEGDVSAKQAEEAILLYKSAAAACTSRSYADMAAELRAECKSGLAKAEKLKDYAQAKNYFEKKAYDKALKIFESLGEYRDCGIFAARCRDELAAAKKRRIPYAVIVGMILPAILFFFLMERFDISIPLCIAVFAAAAAALAYAVYLNGVLSVIVEIASFIMLVPLLIFTVLVYIFNIQAGLAAGIAIGAPLAVTIAVVVLSERQ